MRTQGEHVDQATIAKWERGETAVRVEDLELLAKVYEVTPDRLFFAPGDQATPKLMKAAHDIIITGDSEAVSKWLELGQMIINGGKPK
jgi:transcriptional regulator with XRE-family HTH domain